MKRKASSEKIDIIDAQKSVQTVWLAEMFGGKEIALRDEDVYVLWVNLIHSQFELQIVQNKQKKCKRRMFMFFVMQNNIFIWNRVSYLVDSIILHEWRSQDPYTTSILFCAALRSRGKATKQLAPNRIEGLHRMLSLDKIIYLRSEFRHSTVLYPFPNNAHAKFSCVNYLLLLL